MTNKTPIIIDDRHCICKKCSHANTCEYYTKYQKLLDMFENLGRGDYLIKMTCHIRKCNQYEKENK
jgi:hypothetical protein